MEVPVDFVIVTNWPTTIHHPLKEFVSIQNCDIVVEIFGMKIQNIQPVSRHVTKLSATVKVFFSSVDTLVIGT